MSSTPGTFLDRLGEPERAELMALGTRRRYPGGASLFVVGDEAHEAMVLLEGHVKALVPAKDGREIILNVLPPGAMLGEMAAVDGGERSATVRAIEDVEVLCIATATFEQFLLDHPTVLRDLAVVMATRLRDSDRRQLEFGTGDSLARLCRRMIELADRHGQAGPGGSLSFASPVNQSELGSWSGLSREAIVKSMRAMRTLGWLENDGRQITLLRPDAVRERAQS